MGSGTARLAVSSLPMVNRSDEDGGQIFTEYVARTLEAERAAARLTVDELAMRSGLPVRTLYRVLHAERDINVYQVAQLAAVFGLNPSDIFADAERRKARAETTGVPEQDKLLSEIESDDEQRKVVRKIRNAKVHSDEPPVRGE